MSGAAPTTRTAVACPSCTRGNDSRRRYCGSCGCNLEPVCRACGFGNEPADRFCGGCGQHLFAMVIVGLDTAPVTPPPAAISSPIEAMLASKQAAEQARRATEVMNAQSGIVPSTPTAPSTAAPAAPRPPTPPAKPVKPPATLRDPAKSAAAPAPSAPASAPTPAAAAAAAPAPKGGLARGSVPGLKAVGSNSLSEREFADLMTTVNAKPPTTNLPEGAITQDDLDRLFGGGS